MKVYLKFSSIRKNTKWFASTSGPSGLQNKMAQAHQQLADSTLKLAVGLFCRGKKQQQQKVN